MTYGRLHPKLSRHIKHTTADAHDDLSAYNLSNCTALDSVTNHQSDP